MLAFAAAPSGARSSACAGSSMHPAQTSLKVERGAILCLVNAERTRRGLGPLRRSRLLGRSASGHSHSMIRNGYFGHDGPGGGFVERIRRSGYANGSGSWQVGENLAWGAGERGTPEAIVASWMKSAQHRQNILEREFDHLGLGIARGAPDGSGSSGSLSDSMVVTADFGGRG